MERERRAPVVIGVDTGGTFTDVFASDGRVVKVPSTRASPAAAILNGLRQLGTGPHAAFSHGTTVATNAVLERKGARTALLTTAGFEDVLAIRRQNRPALYDLFARWPDPLVPDEWRLGVDERLTYEGEVLRPVDIDQVDGLIEMLQTGDIESVAVCLLFSYVDGGHEDTVGDFIRGRLGGSVPISLSHLVAPQYGEYERTSTTVMNAYVAPVMSIYLGSLASELETLGITEVHMMHSNGGLLDLQSAAALPVQTVLSGPAAGVVGAHVLAREAGREDIITFDMGGTSTDVAVVPGRVLESREAEVAGFPLLVPMLAIETVGAGGGSIARVDAGAGLHVGPESAGADPGPAAYGRGRAPTVTDANLVLGRLSPRGLLGGAMRLDLDRARDAVETVGRPLGLSVEEAAWSIVRLANSNMERAVRAVTLQRGFDPRRFTLFPFGGAGPLHAAEMAMTLGIPEILVPPHPGVMAALGLTVPDLQRDYHRTVLLPLAEDSLAKVAEAFMQLEERSRAELSQETLFGAPQLSRVVDVHYAGQSFELSIPYREDVNFLRSDFLDAHRQRYGYGSAEQPMEIVTVRLRVTLPRIDLPRLLPAWPEPGPPENTRQIWFGASTGVSGLSPQHSRILWRPSLRIGMEVHGPAIVEQYDSATLIPPGWVARVDPHFNLLVNSESA